MDTARLQPAKRKACLECTKSKRKCDRSYPQCVRCLDKGVQCQYPPSRRMRHIQVPSVDHGHANAGDASFPSFPARHEAHGASSSDSPADFHINDRWLITPDSFVRLLHPRPPSDQPGGYQDRILGDETVEWLDTIKSWMKQWATEGHSPVVHRHLYSGGHMPECVEDAFTVLATYHSSANPQIRKTALQIADRRASRLIASFQGSMSSHDGGNDPALCESVAVVDTQTHLARTLALLTYQVMGLLDTDIRARSNAEDYIETLNSWTTQMLESARLDSLAAEMNTGSPSPESAPTSPSNQTHELLSQITYPDNILDKSFMDIMNMDEFLYFPNLLPPSTSSPPPSNQISSDQQVNTTTQTQSPNSKNPFILPPKRTTSSPSSSSTSAAAGGPPTGPMISQHHHITSLHKAWLIAESVRRICITAIYTQSVYITLKRGVATTTVPSSTAEAVSTCPGGMTFTARAGLWDAPSAYRWFNEVKKTVAADKNTDGGGGESSGDGKGRGLLMVKSTEAWKILEGLVPARPSDVDEFTRAVLFICFGKEWVMERWLDLDRVGEGALRGGEEGLS